MGALILARLMHKIREVIKPVVKINRLFCLTDSSVALSWIQIVEKSYKQFVENRVAEIRKLTKKESWYHISGEENIADLPSRGCLPGQLMQMSKKWFQGPEWMKKCVEDWPGKQSFVKSEDADTEVKKPSIENDVIVCLAKKKMKRI